MHRIISRRGVAVIAMMLWGCANIAHAQLRSIPPDTERAYMRYLHENVIELNGKPEKLAPGIRIRDTENRIITPTMVARDTLVKYRRDRGGAVREVWILTPQEAAR